MKKNTSSNQGNKYAHLAATQSQLDFHELGPLTSEQILEETESFLKNAHHKKLKKLLIITGKGLHSKNGQAVIKPLIQKYLRTSDFVKNFSVAPVNQGGDGAIVVALE